MSDVTRTAITGTTDVYRYDPNGNRIRDSSGSYTYVTTSNRMSTRPGGTPTLDAAGNTTNDGQGLSLTYNDAGQIATATKNGVVAAYVYNHQRQRTRKQARTLTTVYHSAPTGRSLLEPTTSTNGSDTYVWDDTVPIARIAQGGVQYLHTDHLGTPRLATNQQGSKVWGWEGEAFGSTPPNEDPDGDGKRTVVNLRYPGQYYDAETGLFYNWNRYYDPRTGRYVTSDPIGIAGGLNTYSYVFNNPLRWTDPEGLSPLGGSSSGSSAGASACPSDFCKRLAERIKNVENRIARRRGQLDENPQGLPEAVPGDDKKPSASRRGHRRLINEDKALLASLNALYLARCVQTKSLPLRGGPLLLVPQILLDITFPPDPYGDLGT